MVKEKYKVLFMNIQTDAYTKVKRRKYLSNAGGEFKKVFPFAIEVVGVHVLKQIQIILYIPFAYVGGISKWVFYSVININF